MSSNPFEYDQASLIPKELVAHYYIDDFNHGRLLRSRRNIFLVGERGSGKTMALLYNSLQIQHLLSTRQEAEVDLKYVGVLVPANTPLVHRVEYTLLEEYPASVLSEHFLALSIMYHVSETLGLVRDRVTAAEAHALGEEVEFYFDTKLPQGSDVFDGICQFAQRESINAQQLMNRPSTEELYSRCLSFATAVIPLLRAVRKIATLSGTHFMLMIDDAHDFNAYQVRALNSWIAYRDRSLFSLKVATTRVGRPERSTGAGGAIVEGHDFITIDMEYPLHSGRSEFGRFADKVVRRRLERVGITCHPDEFFPVHASLKKDLSDAAEAVRKRAETLFRGSTPKQITDYVYKQRWAEYIRQRGPRANRPMYSGFSTLVYLSTGVIRNLLEPCWWMWDAAESQLGREGKGRGRVRVIPPTVQTTKIMERSDVAWQKVGALANTIDGCSRDDGIKVMNMFEQLARLFVRRLASHASEPSATSFSISARHEDKMALLRPLLAIAQKGQVLYVRMGAAKARGQREEYYVPNRMLWPSRGLDPHGQHARVSIKAMHLVNATEGKAIPLDDTVDESQQRLFVDNKEDGK